jgi:hypothetical protein
MEPKRQVKEAQVDYYRAGDQPRSVADTGAIDLSPFIGTWVNTKKDTGGFVKLIVTNRDGKLVLRAFGASSSGPSDWGEVEAFGFSDDVDSHNGRAFSAFYDTGSIEVALQGNLNLGLLVLVTFNRFKDGSRRSNYICREFFHR